MQILNDAWPWFGTLHGRPLDVAELMRINVETGFTFDANGRMLRTNEPREDARRPAWRLWVGHTSNGDIVRFNTDLPDGVVSELEAILSTTEDPTRSRTTIEQVLTRGGAVTEFRAGPAYYCAETPAPTHDVVRITGANRDLARDTYRWLYDEADDWQPSFAVVSNGSVVSVCFSSRMGPHAAAAGVDTLAEYRGRGYASAVTAAWASAILTTGRIAFYSTGCENRASQGVARRLGFPQFGERLSWR